MKGGGSTDKVGKAEKGGKTKQLCCIFDILLLQSSVWLLFSIFSSSLRSALLSKWCFLS